MAGRLKKARVLRLEYHLSAFWGKCMHPCPPIRVDVRIEMTLIEQAIGVDSRICTRVPRSSQEHTPIRDSCFADYVAPIQHKPQCSPCGGCTRYPGPWKGLHSSKSAPLQKKNHVGRDTFCRRWPTIEQHVATKHAHRSGWCVRLPQPEKHGRNPTPVGPSRWQWGPIVEDVGNRKLSAWTMVH